jgi:SPP1 gp7 family putative phage head morphogenesis protein
MIGDYIGKINQQAEQAILSGWSPAQLAKEIQKIDGQMKAGRANLIARDQIGKLNGQVTQARMEAAGLDMYIWSTSGDERVRSSHEMMDGGLCRWDDASVYSDDGGKTWKPRPAGAIRVHPGEDISCRCCALSYWDELVDEVDQKIAEIEGLDALSAQNIAAMPKAQGKRRAGAASQKQTKKKPTAKPPPATVPQPGNKTAKPAKQGASTKIGQTENSKVESAINSKLSELREWGKASKREQASMMTQDGKVIGSAKGNKSEVILSGKMSAALDKQPPNSLILLHNHPGSTSFSMTDFSVMCKNGSIKELRVVGSNGRTYRVSVGNGERPSLAEMEKYEQSIETRIKQEVANKTVMRQLPKGENMWSVYLSERNKAFAEKYGWEYKEGKLDG